MQTSTFEQHPNRTNPRALNRWLKNRALEEGLDLAGITGPDAKVPLEARLRDFLQRGFHGGMSWMEANPERRAGPAMMWPDVRSILMVGLNYAPAADPMEKLAERSHAAISVYAQGADYHDVIKPKLKAVARDFAQLSGKEVKVFVDTAPVMEKPLAEGAGLGWQGKHTNLVSRGFGSWLFLGAMFTAAEVEPDAREPDRCGACRRCLDICPTAAFPAPYQLDARRCISYLTIEHKGQIPLEFRTAIGNRVYGCDDCLAVCPWNKFAQTAREARLSARESASNPPLVELLALDDAAFRVRFAGSPIKRTGRDRFVRNVLIAAGNSQDQSLVPKAEGCLGDLSPLVRGMAAWALRSLVRDPVRFAALKRSHLPHETDAGVRQEWRAGETPL